MYQALFSGQNISFDELLVFRENQHQQLVEFQRDNPGVVVDYHLNIPGQKKHFPLGKMVFQEGLARFFALMNTYKVPVFKFEVSSHTGGFRALFCLEGSEFQIKQYLIRLEEQDQLARLFDFDVFSSANALISRSDLGRIPRPCLICDESAVVCRRESYHSPHEIFREVEKIMITWLDKRIQNLIAQTVVQALLSEVLVTPKPGLVDQANPGAHDDMDTSHFINSATSLWSFFEACAQLGQNILLSQHDLFFELRQLGLLAEQTMQCATGGVNTHQGAIFSLGILASAAARLLKCDGVIHEKRLYRLSSEIARGVLMDYHPLEVVSGQIKGARQEAINGFPSVSKVGLPALRHYLKQGDSQNDALSKTLIHLMAVVDDQNIVRRSDDKIMAEIQAQAKHIICQGNSIEMIKEFDRKLIQMNLSPGGSADLLAVTFFINLISQPRNCWHKFFQIGSALS